MGRAWGWGWAASVAALAGRKRGRADRGGVRADRPDRYGALSVQYPVDDLTTAELARLAPHVTHPTRPVFGLVNLPETVKGALFARYSRYPGTIRRLFLDEFAESLEAGQGAPAWDGSEGARAADLYDRIFLGFGDDSIAQLGGIHVAAEWCSNVLTKILQRPRIGAYLEQSTRYIAYDQPITSADGERGYRYYRDPSLEPGYQAAMDELFRIYSDLLPRVTAWCGERYPAPDGTPPAAHDRAIRAKALDLLRGLLPASTLSHVGIYASGQTYEQLILHLLAHPLPEARQYGRWILDAVQAVTPSFVSRVERPDRGGRWVEYLQEREQAADRWAARLGLDQATAGARAAEEAHSAVRLVHVDGDEDDLLAGLLFEASAVGEVEARRIVAELLDRRPGRAARRPRGAAREPPSPARPRLRAAPVPVRDHQRLRRVPRPPAAPDADDPVADPDAELGAEVPDEVEQAGGGDDYRRALERSAQAWSVLNDAGRPKEAAYAVCLGYRIRYSMDLNARAAMQLIELRSGREGHPSYRAVAHEMHRLIGEVHPTVAAAMRHVDTTAEPRLERILSEMRTERRSGGQ